MSEYMNNNLNEREGKVDENVAELAEDSLEEVAGGQATCIPKEPIIDTLPPLPQPVPADQYL